MRYINPISHQELETLAAIACSLMTTVMDDELDKKISNRIGTITVKRERVEVEAIFNRLCLTYSKRAYRMRAGSFYKLHKKLHK